ncbi:hypothetical protein AHAS_Ahas13G0279500 [Arachis hypogaea]
MASGKAPETSKGKESITEIPSTNLKVLSRDLDTIIGDPVDTTNVDKIFFPFVVENQLHYLLSPLLLSSRIDEVLPFFPSLPNQELLIKK